MRFASTGNANGLPSVPKTGSDSKKGWAHLFLLLRWKKGGSSVFSPGQSMNWNSFVMLLSCQCWFWAIPVQAVHISKWAAAVTVWCNPKSQFGGALWKGIVSIWGVLETAPPSGHYVVYAKSWPAARLVCGVFMIFQMHIQWTRLKGECINNTALYKMIGVRENDWPDNQKYSILFSVSCLGWKTESLIRAEPLLYLVSP